MFYTNLSLLVMHGKRSTTTHLSEIDEIYHSGRYQAITHLFWEQTEDPEQPAAIQVEFRSAQKTAQIVSQSISFI